MGGMHKVLFNVAGASNASANFVLGEGESRNEIKVVGIDEPSGAVTFDNHGTIQKIVIERASPLNTYVPPSLPPVPVAVPAASMPATAEPAMPAQSGGGASVVVIGSQRNSRLTDFRHINGVMPQSGGYNPNNFVFGVSAAPASAPAANQLVQTTPTASPTLVQSAPATPAQSTPAQSTPVPVPMQPSLPNGPRQMSVGADMGTVAFKPIDPAQFAPAPPSSRTGP